MANERADSRIRRTNHDAASELDIDHTELAAISIFVKTMGETTVKDLIKNLIKRNFYK